MRIGMIGVGRIGACTPGRCIPWPRCTSSRWWTPRPAGLARRPRNLGVPWGQDVGDLLAGGVDGWSSPPPPTPTPLSSGPPPRPGSPSSARSRSPPTWPGPRRSSNWSKRATLGCRLASRGASTPVSCRPANRCSQRSWAGCTRSGPAPWTHHLLPPPTSAARVGFLGLQRPRHRCRALGHRPRGEHGLRHRLQPGRRLLPRAGDVDTGAALLTLDDGTLAIISATRYNGAGYDVRLELLGSEGSISVGLDDRLPLRSAEAGVTWPAGTAYTNFLDRFRAAYVAELEAFVEVVSGRPSPCSPADALETFYVAEACELSRAARDAL